MLLCFVFYKIRNLNLLRNSLIEILNYFKDNNNLFFNPTKTAYFQNVYIDKMVSKTKQEKRT